MPQGAPADRAPGSNSLVDFRPRRQRAAPVSIIARIDTVSDDAVEDDPLQHANAAELARTLTLLRRRPAAAQRERTTRVRRRRARIRSCCPARKTAACACAR
jgi:general secretion pathway protein D